MAAPLTSDRQVRARAIAIAKGEYKPKPGEPKIWFTSRKAVAEVLSDQNRALLKVIRETNPDSTAVLAKITGRQPGNLSRTLKTMSRYGWVDPSTREDARQAGSEGDRISDPGGRLRARIASQATRDERQAASSIARCGARRARKRPSRVGTVGIGPAGGGVTASARSDLHPRA